MPPDTKWKGTGMGNYCNGDKGTAARALSCLWALWAAVPAACAPASAPPNARLSGGKTDVTIHSHPHAAGAETAAALRDMMRRLRDPHASVKGLLPHLGHVQERQEDAGYDIAPLDKRFGHLFLGLYPRAWQTATHGGAPAGETPYYLEATLRPETRLHLADLAGVFGAWRHGVPAPEGNPFVVRFDHADRQEPASPYEVQVDVSLSGEPERAQTQIKTVTITREKRL